jgi:hypothetical protein
MSVRRFTRLSNALSKKAENFDINCTAGFAITHIEERSLEQLRDPSESTTEAFPMTYMSSVEVVILRCKIRGDFRSRKVLDISV